ncbi:MAG: hypothetical protein R3A79_14735 [Nannocystaceae bacterium]
MIAATARPRAALAFAAALALTAGLSEGTASAAPTIAPAARDASEPASASASAEASALPETKDTAPSGAPPPKSAARRGVGVEPTAFQAASGVSSEGRWLVNVSGGYPWWSARLQLGLRHGLSPLFEVQTARFRRWRPAVGLAMLWLERPRARISGEALFGWLVQGGELARRGANVELRVRAAFPLRRAAPYVMAGSQHTLLADRTTILSAAGESTSWSLRGEWTGWGTVGLIAAVTQNVGLDLAVDLTWVDAPGTVAIPGAHAGLIIGGVRRTGAGQRRRGRDAKGAKP